MKNPCLKHLADIKHLTASWQSIQTKGASGGIDKVSIEDYKKHITRNLISLSNQLLNMKWKPQPYMGIQIPKKTEGTRMLGLLSIEDKIVQQGIKFLIEPQIEKSLHSDCYAYRPGKGHTKAIKRCFHEFKQKTNKIYVRMDIKNFFDTINRDILMNQLSDIIEDINLLTLIRLCISMGRVSQTLKWEESSVGIPQGAILSPLLSNLYLQSFDHFMKNISNAYIRYSDDCVAWFNDRETANTALSSASDFLSKKLGLSLNEKIKIDYTESPMTYLGLNISNKGITISNEKKCELEYKISHIQIKDNMLTPQYMKTLEGIRLYYVKVLSEDYGSLMDGWLMKTIQNYITTHNLGIKEALSLFKPLNGFVNKEAVRQYIKTAVIESQKNTVQKVVASRKKEYQRMESENSELAITSPGYFIGLSGRGLTLRKNGQPVKIPPMAALKHISIITDGISISSNAITFCMENGIAIDFFNIHTKHVASILSSKYLYTSLWKVQAYLNEQIIKELGKRIILGKIKNQYSLSKYFNKYHKHIGNDIAFTQYQNSVESLISRIKDLKDSDLHEYRQRLMSYEAASAMLYWEYVRELIKDDIDGFHSRVKQGATDLFNSMLNYGYAILYPRIWQAALQHQLNPYIGFVHYLEGNANLIFDMIELFRAQAVERVIITLVQKKEKLVVKDGKLDDETKKKLTHKILERLNKKEKYRGEMRSFVDIINAQFNELISAMTKNTTFRPYLAKW